MAPIGTATKETIFGVLAQVSSSRYTKRTAFDLLERISPDLVENACPHAKALLNQLRSL